jgi:Integrase core domain
MSAVANSRSFSRPTTSFETTRSCASGKPRDSAARLHGRRRRRGPPSRLATGAWTTQAARNLIMRNHPTIGFLIRDGAGQFIRAFDDVFRSDCTTIIPTPPRTPVANAYSERWVGTVRRELLDRTLVWNRQHLERLHREYVEHYNTHRPHRARPTRTQYSRHPRVPTRPADPTTPHLQPTSTATQPEPPRQRPTHPDFVSFDAPEPLSHPGSEQPTALTAHPNAFPAPTGSIPSHVRREGGSGDRRAHVQGHGWSVHAAFPSDRDTATAVLRACARRAAAGDASRSRAADARRARQRSVRPWDRRGVRIRSSLRP